MYYTAVGFVFERLLLPAGDLFTQFAACTSGWSRRAQTDGFGVSLVSVALQSLRQFVTEAT